MVDLLESLFIWPVAVVERIPWRVGRFVGVLIGAPLMLLCFGVVMIPLALAILWESTE